jgi:hypothetical protein
MQGKFAYGGSFLNSNQFLLLLLQLPQNLMLNSKALKNNSKIIVLIHESKSVIHTVEISPGEILLCTLSQILMKLKVNGQTSHTSWYEVKHVPVLTKIGCGLKKTPQHFFSSVNFTNILTAAFVSIFLRLKNYKPQL